MIVCDACGKNDPTIKSYTFLVEVTKTGGMTPSNAMPEYKKVPDLCAGCFGRLKPLIVEAINKFGADDVKPE